MPARCGLGISRSLLDEIGRVGAHCSYRGLRRAVATLPPLFFELNERGPLETPLLPWGPTRPVRCCRGRPLIPWSIRVGMALTGIRCSWGPTTRGCLAPMLTGVGVAVLGHPCSLAFCVASDTFRWAQRARPQGADSFFSYCNQWPLTPTTTVSRSKSDYLHGSRPVTVLFPLAAHRRRIRPRRGWEARLVRQEDGALEVPRLPPVHPLLGRQHAGGRSGDHFTHLLHRRRPYCHPPGVQPRSGWLTEGGRAGPALLRDGPSAGPGSARLTLQELNGQGGRIEPVW